MPRLPLIAIVLASSLLAGCDMIAGQLGIESPEKIAAARDADGKAIGGACRHAGRAIEDCYMMNKKADKAAVFAGWRDMNDYMRENKIAEVVPQLSPPGAAMKLAQAAPDQESWGLRAALAGAAAGLAAGFASEVAGLASSSSAAAAFATWVVGGATSVGATASILFSRM